MTTLEEKQKELDNLQAAFDEYIVSSQELEEELDAEFTKCQNDLTKAESRNTAIASQLAKIQPQLNSLETKLSSLNTQLSSETQKRISAEMRTEEAENKLRESEGTLAAVRSSEVRKLKEENEELCERLAFLESEAEDHRNELNTERERHREEVEELKGDVAVLKDRLTERNKELDLLKSDQDNRETVRDGDDDKVAEQWSGRRDAAESMFGGEADLPPPPTAKSRTTNDDREEYIRTLKDELELVTEQLTEAKTKLSQAQAELEEVSVNKTLENGTNFGPTTINGATPTAESGTTNDDREEYTRTLEDELELVTEQLTEAKTTLSQAQVELEEALVEARQANTTLENGTNSRPTTINGATAVAADMSNQLSDKITELSSTVKLLQEENAALQEESRRLTMETKPKLRWFELFTVCIRSKRS